MSLGRIKTEGVKAVMNQPTKSQPIGFMESKTLFGQVHSYLINKGILDGSSHSLVEDLLDGTKTDEVLVNELVNKLSGLSPHSLIQKLVYIALGGFYKLEISKRCKKILKRHLSDVTDALNSRNVAYGATLISKKKSDTIYEDDAIKALNMRADALLEVLALNGDHFLKRAQHVAPSFKIRLSKIRGQE